MDRLVARLIAKSIDPLVRAELIRLLDSQRNPQKNTPSNDDSARIRRLIEAIMSLPEFHLG